jgi:hypothetical protein
MEWTLAMRDERPVEKPVTPQPIAVKEWNRRHSDGSLGSVVAWSDGRYTAGHFEYRPRAGGIQVGPRYPYPTLAEAFGGSDRDAAEHGHDCSGECALWREVSLAGVVGA